jgi:tRNA pseudouridine55 synthase
MSGTSLADVERAAAAFVGDIEQIPPMVSAVKVGGKRLHELARQGIEVEREARPVTIHQLAVSEGPASDPHVFTLEVHCSSGTYIRTLAADIGHALGGGAHLRNLRRTSVGPFGLDEAVALEAVSPEVVRPMADVVRHLEPVVVSEEVEAAVSVGKVLGPEQIELAGEGPWALIGGSGDLLAVYERFRGDTVKPSVVVSAR